MSSTLVSQQFVCDLHEVEGRRYKGSSACSIDMSRFGPKLERLQKRVHEFIHVHRHEVQFPWRETLMVAERLVVDSRCVLEA